MQLWGVALPVFGSAAVHFPIDNNWLNDHVEIDSDRLPPFTAGDPGSKFYYRAKDGAAAWSAISGSGLDFVYQQQRAMSQSLGVCSIDFDETWVMDYWTSSWNIPSSGVSDGAPLGTTSICGPSGTIDRALIRINHDDDIDWEWEQFGSVGSGEYDLHSVMVHEFGHAVGGIDFLSGTPCTSYYTMCGILSPGQNYQRTITSHEQKDVASKY